MTATEITTAIEGYTFHKVIDLDNGSVAFVFINPKGQVIIAVHDPGSIRIELP